MRYEVYKWDGDDINSYDDTYGEGAWEADSGRPSCAHSIMQYGTLVKETDDEIEATTAVGKAYEEFRFKRGEAAVWDNIEKEWFN